MGYPNLLKLMKKTAESQSDKMTYYPPIGQFFLCRYYKAKTIFGNSEYYDRSTHLDKFNFGQDSFNI
jgi:hypothetical protein